MAASSIGRGSEIKSAFEKQDQSQKDGCSWLDPPVIGIVPYATAGLKGLYTQVTSPELVLDDDTGAFTDKNGTFCPKTNMPLLARRYRFVGVLGEGGSSITIRAIDTFRGDGFQVAIKVLSVNYYRLGYQESSSIRRLNKADPKDFSGTLRLLNIFSFAGHFCMVFELLHPKPLHHYFKEITDNKQKLRWIRKIAVRLLQVLGFLHRQNVIHADLKPENVLCTSDDLSSGVKVIDFGNAIHCVYDELSLYYDDFELQTLLYRAPEVLFGLPFGPEIDMWSLGCILAELYIGQPLFFALSKDKLLQQMVAVLGPMPANILQRGKFFQEYIAYTGKTQTSLATWGRLHSELRGVQDPDFVSFIAAMLQYNPNDRISVTDAFQHSFLAPEIAVRYLIPGDKVDYPKIGISPQTYNLSPAISSEVKKDHLSGVDFLRHGTTAPIRDNRLDYRGGPILAAQRNVTEISSIGNPPMISNRKSHMPAFHVEQSSSSNDVQRIPAFHAYSTVDQSALPRKESRAHRPIEGRNVLPLGRKVRQPLAVPGIFPNALVGEKKDLSDRVSDAYASYRNSHQTELPNSASIRSPDGCPQDHLPSSSYQDVLSSESNRSVFTSGIDNSISVSINIADIHHLDTSSQNSTLKTGSDQMSRCVDDDKELLQERRTITDDGHHRATLGKKKAMCQRVGNTQDQKGEIVLGEMVETDCAAKMLETDYVRRKSESETHQLSETEISSTTIKNTRFSDEPVQNTKSRRRKIFDVNKEGFDQSKLIPSRKRKKIGITEADKSPSKRWENLELLRSKALKKNKRGFDVGKESRSHSAKSPLLAKQESSKKMHMQRENQSPEEKTASPISKRQQVSFSPSALSTDTKPASHTPSKCANLATSIAKLKSSTPTTPGGDHSHILLMSPFPTPDNAPTIPSTDQELPSPLVDRDNSTSPDLLDSLEEEGSDESGMHLMQDSPDTIEIDAVQQAQVSASYALDMKPKLYTDGGSTLGAYKHRQDIPIKKVEERAHFSKNKPVSNKREQRKSEKTGTKRQRNRKRKRKEDEMRLEDSRMQGKEKMEGKMMNKSIKKEGNKKRTTQRTSWGSHQNTRRTPETKHKLKVKKTSPSQSTSKTKTTTARTPKKMVKRKTSPKSNITPKTKRSPNLKKTPNMQNVSKVKKTPNNTKPSNRSNTQRNTSSVNVDIPMASYSSSMQNWSSVEEEIEYNTQRRQRLLTDSAASKHKDRQHIESCDSDSSGPVVDDRFDKILDEKATGVNYDEPATDVHGQLEDLEDFQESDNESIHLKEEKYREEMADFMDEDEVLLL